MSTSNEQTSRYLSTLVEAHVEGLLLLMLWMKAASTSLYMIYVTPLWVLLMSLSTLMALHETCSLLAIPVAHVCALLYMLFGLEDAQVCHLKWDLEGSKVEAVHVS